MTLWINQQQMESIRQHGVRDYPNECCGVLLGYANSDHKEVREVVALANLRHNPKLAQELVPLREPGRESERNRFLIDPKDQVRVGRDARERGFEILGYYHSHPDHPARPSSYDRELAWPWYSYLIISVQRGEAKDLTSWVLADDRSQFHPEHMEVLSP